jgi:hypothetical protein
MNDHTEPNHNQDITFVLDPAGYEKRTLEIRGFCQKIDRILSNGLLDEVRQEMANDIPNIVPINGQKEPVARMLSLFTGVSRIVVQAAGHNFDTVINPCSGSDVSAGITFGCNQLVTIDNGDLFALHDSNDDDLKDRLRRNLHGKLISGHHAFYSNQGLVAYAMELYLVGADLDSITIISEKKVGNVTMTKTQFRIGDRIVMHTNFSKVNLKTSLSSNPEDVFLEDELFHIIESSKQIVLLSKAGGDGMVGPNIATTSLYPMMPEHTVVVSDANEDESLSQSGAILKFANLKTFQIENELNNLQGGSPPESFSLNGRNDPRISYGYAIDLRRLKIFEIGKS